MLWLCSVNTPIVLKNIVTIEKEVNITHSNSKGNSIQVLAYVHFKYENINSDVINVTVLIISILVLFFIIAPLSFVTLSRIELLLPG